MKRMIFVFTLALIATFASTTDLQAQRTGVYVNNQEISPNDLYLLQQLTGPLYQGFYYLDQYGNFGVVGYRPAYNLPKLVQQRQAQFAARQRNHYNAGNSYRQVAGSSGYHFKEGKTRGYYNSTTGTGMTTDGTKNGTYFSYDGKVFTLPN